MTDKIAKLLKMHMKELTLSPHGDGRFEVFADDERVYSKLETGAFPDEAMILDALRERVDRG